MNEYYFQGVRFVPGYNDFDWDDFKCNAKSEAEAWVLLDKFTRKLTWKSVGLTSINGVKVTNTAKA
jgi:hypothetical protein